MTIKDMTASEAKEIIKKEVFRRFDQWRKDYEELDEEAYGWKYGFHKSEKYDHIKDNLKSLMLFQKYIFSGMVLAGWESIGIERKALWRLSMDGWISARSGHYGNPAFYYLTQQRMKEIYKEARS